MSSASFAPRGHHRPKSKRSHAAHRRTRRLPWRPRLELLEDRCVPTAVSLSYDQIPLSFEPNRGQADSHVAFLTQGSGYGLSLTSDGAVLSLYHKSPTGESQSAALPAADTALVRMSLLGSNPFASVVGVDRLTGISNYLLGNNPSAWHTNIPTYARVEYQGVYPGIDLIYYGNQRQLEYDYIVAPGADPGAISMAFAGAQSISMDGEGNLLLGTAGGTVMEHAPVVYQESSGVRQVVPGRYVIDGNGHVGVAVGNYDRFRPLVIDPILGFSTYFGGGFADEGDGIAADPAGNVYVTGVQSVYTYPTPTSEVFVRKYDANGGSVYSTYLNGGGDAFVTKLSPDGATLAYSTYLGGEFEDQANGIAVDSTGNAYITGNTSSTNYTVSTFFPILNALQPGYAGGQYDAFLTKLSTTGSPVYSTYIGGRDYDIARGVAVDGSGSVYVAGNTFSSDFPTVNALQPGFAGGLLNGPDAYGDGFVLKVNSAGSALLDSTYLGGTGQDGALAVALDASGNVYVAGATNSLDFPTRNSIQGNNAGAYDGFLTKIDADWTALDYSTYLGGQDIDKSLGVAVDAGGNAYITGKTASTNFPTVNPSQGSNAGSSDAFVAKVVPSGTLDISGGLLTYHASSGVANQISLVFDRSSGAYLLTDGAELISLGPGAQAGGWSGDGTHTVKGPASSFSAGTLDLGDGNDQAAIESLAQPFTILGGTGDDTIQVTPASGQFANLGSQPLQVIGGGGNDQLVINDQNNGQDTRYSLTTANSGGLVSSSLLASTGGVVYSQIANVMVNMGPGSNAVQDPSLAADTTLGGGSLSLLGSVTTNGHVFRVIGVHQTVVSDQLPIQLGIPNTPTSSQLIADTVDLSANPTLEVALDGAFMARPGQIFNIVHAGGGIIGHFRDTNGQDLLDNSTVAVQGHTFIVRYLPAGTPIPADRGAIRAGAPNGRNVDVDLIEAVAPTTTAIDSPVAGSHFQAGQITIAASVEVEPPAALALGVWDPLARAAVGTLAVPAPGSVTFVYRRSDGAILTDASVPLVNGIATDTPAGLAPGTYTVTVLYGGYPGDQSKYSGSTSGPLNFTVDSTGGGTPVGGVIQLDGVLTPAGVVAFAVGDDSKVYENTGAGWHAVGLSFIETISATVNGAGNAVLFAATQGHDLFFFDPARGLVNTGLRFIRSLAATSDAQGNAVVFAVTDAHDLFEYGPTIGLVGTGLKFIDAISATTDAAGNPLVYAVTQAHDLFSFGPTQGVLDLHSRFITGLSAVHDSTTGQGVVYATTQAHDLLAFDLLHGWQNLNSRFIQELSAGSNGAGQPEVYAITQGQDLAKNDAQRRWSILRPPVAVHGHIQALGGDHLLGAGDDGTVLVYDGTGWLTWGKPSGV